MEWILKNMPLSTLQFFMPMLMVKLGNAFMNKDDNTTGTDDLMGKIFIAAAPAVEAIDSKNETAKRAALEVVYTTLGNYLGK